MFSDEDLRKLALADTKGDEHLAAFWLKGYQDAKSQAVGPVFLTTPEEAFARGLGFGFFLAHGTGEEEV